MSKFLYSFCQVRNGILPAKTYGNVCESEETFGTTAWRNIRKGRTASAQILFDGNVQALFW